MRATGHQPTIIEGTCENEGDVECESHYHPHSTLVS
jgi:hypothetical protein